MALDLSSLQKAVSSLERAIAVANLTFAIRPKKRLFLGFL